MIRPPLLLGFDARKLTEDFRSAAHPDGLDRLAASWNDLGGLWESLEPLIDSVKALQESLKGVAENRPIELPNGKFLTAIENHRTTIDPIIAKKVIEAEFGEACARGAVQLEESITQARIKAAINLAATRDTKADTSMKTLKTTMALIGAAGGLKKGIYYSVSEVHPSEITTNPDGTIRRDVSDKKKKKER